MYVRPMGGYECFIAASWEQVILLLSTDCGMDKEMGLGFRVSGV